MNLLRILMIADQPPSEGPERDRWLSMDGVDELLELNATSDNIILGAWPNHCFMLLVSVPSDLVARPDFEDLIGWNFMIPSGWGVSHSFGTSPDVWLAPPMDRTGSTTLDQAEPFFFSRYFEGRPGNANSVELAERFVHLSGIHYMPDLNAYCRLDQNGDLEKAVDLAPSLPNDQQPSGQVILCRRDLLDSWMAVTDSTLVMLFDFTRWTSAFGGWPEGDTESVTRGTVAYRQRVVAGVAGYRRGVMIIHPREDRAKIIERLTSRVATDRDYASFTILDFKNGGEVKEWSSHPSQMASYFVRSPLPFETSPVFFRPEVLQKYKADSEKYTLRGRTVSCRGTWHLQTYDINEAGQVHTYLVYLSHLPYAEQLHWKAYNEPPKGSISSRAFATDFEGQFYEGYDPLESVKEVIQELNQAQPDWWIARPHAVVDRSQYPVTASADEWSTEIMNLQQLVVEGIKSKSVRRLLEKMGQDADHKLGSLKLIEAVALAQGASTDEARAITASLHELHVLRSILRGHSPGSEVGEIRRQAIRMHGSYQKHYRDLCTRVDKALRSVKELLSTDRPA